MCENCESTHTKKFSPVNAFSSCNGYGRTSNFILGLRNINYLHFVKFIHNSLRSDQDTICLISSATQTSVFSGPNMVKSSASSDIWSSDGVKTFFSETETLAKTEVSRHETSRDISDLVETRRDWDIVKMFETWDTAETQVSRHETSQNNLTLT